MEKRFVHISLFLMTAFLFFNAVNTAVYSQEPKDLIEKAGSGEKTISNREFGSDSVSFRKVADTVVEKLKNTRAFEYANDPEYWTKKKVKSGPSLAEFLFSMLRHPATRILFYL